MTAVDAPATPVAPPEPGGAVTAAEAPGVAGSAVTAADAPAAPGVAGGAVTAEVPAAPVAPRVAAAERLVAGLRERVRRRPGMVLSGAPLGWPGDGAVVGWLRRMTDRPLYTTAYEELMSRRWLGIDPFGLRDLPPPPPFLSDVDVTGLRPELVAPFLRRLSMTRAAPTAAELVPGALRRDAGRVSAVRRPGPLRRWGRPAAEGAPLLPAWTRVPHVVHGIWLGGGAMPAGSAYWRNYAEGARRYAGRVDFVLWTDVPRSSFAQVAARPAAPAGPDPLAAARRLWTWAVEHGISLVSVSEVFSAAAPMTLHASYTLELAKQLPRGYAAASDGLRVEVVHRFGGLYADGDLSFEPPASPPTYDAGVPAGPPSRSGYRGPRGIPVTDGSWRPEELPEFFDRLAGSPLGFTLNPHPDGRVGADVVAAPARHPALALWVECARVNYLVGQPQLFGGERAMAVRYVGRPWQEHRYLTPHRSGRVHLCVLGLLRVPSAGLTSTKRAIRDGRELSWLPPGGREHAVPAGPDHVLARCATFLQWQLLARDGNLYLSAVAPLVRALPDPDAAWIALLRTLRAVPGTVPVTSVTDTRRNDDGTLDRVLLPPEAEAELDRSARPERWLGSSLGRASVWLLDERVSPCAFAAAPDAGRETPGPSAP